MKKELKKYLEKKTIPLVNCNLSIIKEFAEENNLEFLNVRLCMLDENDIKGVPQFDNFNNPYYLSLPHFLPFKNNKIFKGKKGVIFLGEIDRSMSCVYETVIEILFNGGIKENKLLDDWFIVVGGKFNELKDNEIVDFKQNIIKVL